MELILLLLIIMQLEIGLVALLLIKRRRVRMKRPTFIDTSVLMDGRIIPAAQAGFVPNHLAIPESVLAELQLLADGSDSDKRARARHGLDVAALLRETKGVDVTIAKDGKAEAGVDERLLELAAKHHGSICTIDFNLNKVAAVKGIPVLNINELAQALRMKHLPGEKVSLPITQKGNDPHQGVGYLSDGTMVVVEQASGDVGKTVEIEFIRSLQTVAGRMLFAKKLGGEKSKQPGRAGKAQPSKNQRTIKKTQKPRSKEDALVELANK